MPHRILIADDDRELCRLLTRYLVKQGFEAESVRTAEAALERLRGPDAVPDLLILDVMLPGKDGLTALRELRIAQDLPVVMLSARGEPLDRVLGLELGADDYLAKPCLPRELLARINALLRRGPARARGVLAVGGLRLDVPRRAAEVDGHALRLTSAEFALLACLAEHVGRPVDKGMLSKAGLGRDSEPDRRIDVHVSRLRQKLAGASASAPVIEAVRGVGYVMVESRA